MTCRGYDARAVKVPKSVKRLAANYMDPHKRGQLIRDYARIIAEQNRTRGRKGKDE